MRIFRHFFRYAIIALTIVGLAIGLNNCMSSGPTGDTSSPPAVTSPGASMSPGMNHGRKININTAILSELDKLEAKLGVPGISNQIQSGRPYGTPDDLVTKKILTQAQFDQVKDQLTVEEIALTGEAKDVDYLTKLALMQGHMLVAKELLALNLPKQAEPHLGHPVEEIYVDIEEQLSERKVPVFKDVLSKVQDLVRAKPNDPAVDASFQAAVVAIDKAIAALPAQQRQTPTFVLKSVTELLETALAEYQASISDGKITQPIEYQDSRGFVAYIKDTLLPPIAGKLDPAVASELKTKLAKLYTAWPEAVPPAKLVFSADQVASQVKGIEQQIAKVMG
jgi:Helix-hairpin-helix motif